MIRSIRVVLTLALVALLGLPIAAQCGIDDGAVGPCCAPTQLAIPVFPPMQLAGKGAVLKDCGVEAQFPTGNLVTNVQVAPDYWLFTLAINGGGAVIPGSTFFGKYSRTWMENTGGGQIQVWRFLVNGDATYTIPAGAVPGLPVPTSAFAPYNLPVHFSGAIDYAKNCATGQWNIAYWLTHGCPVEMHAPWSARPIPAAGAWARRTYHFVAPANFNFAAVGPTPVGTLFGESLRMSAVSSAGVYFTQSETPVINGSVTNGAPFCACLPPGAAPASLRSSDMQLNGFAACMGAVLPFNTLPVPGIFPTGMRSLSLGAHSLAPAAGQFYPSIGTRVAHQTAVIVDNGPCTGITAGNIHLYGGVVTSGSNPLVSFTAAPVAGAIGNQLDLGNMLVTGAGAWVIGFGAPYVSDRVFGLTYF